MQGKRNNIQMPYTFEGVDVVDDNGSMDQYLWGDVFLTHLEYTHHAFGHAQVYKRPAIHFVHNDTPYPSVTMSRANVHVVYNSEWIAKKLAYDWPSMVMRPPVDYEYYNVNEDPYSSKYITLINLNENKGGKILTRLAAAMPDKQFLVVQGSYEEQFFKPAKNITYLPKQVDIRPVYKDTRILLMPSRYESWGRTATEAMSNGIPVVCTATPGLRENCGEAALYIPDRGKLILDEKTKMVVGDDGDSYNISPIVKAIKRLDNRKFYDKHSELGRARAKELDPLKELETFERWMREMVISSRQ